MAKPLIIDTNDFTPYFTEIGYQVEYASVDGGQGGLMLSGTTTADEIATKAIVTLPCYPLNEEQISDLLQIVYSGVYHTVTFYDPRAGMNRTMQARRQVSQQKYRGFGANGLEYWTGTVVTLTER